MYSLPRRYGVDAENCGSTASGSGTIGGFEDPRRGRRQYGYHARDHNMWPGRWRRLAGEERHPQVSGGVRAIHPGSTEESIAGVGQGSLIRVFPRARSPTMRPSLGRIAFALMLAA